ncbi:MAG: hypothetical protein ACLFP2_02410 [Candidatus Woesearchaeota archaeon]
MKIEYYPEYICGEKFFLDPKSLNGVIVSEKPVSPVSLLSFDKIPKQVPKTPQPMGTMQTPVYYQLEGITQDEWVLLNQAANKEDLNQAKVSAKQLDELVTDNTPRFYRESNDQYENRVIMVL